MLNPVIYTVRAYFQGLTTIIRSPKLISLCIIPWLGGIFLWVGLFIASLFYRDSLALLIFSDTASWLSAVIEGALIPALFFVSAVVAVLLSLIISEFTIDPLIIDIFERFHASPLPHRSTSQQIIDGVVRLSIITPLSILCFLFGFIPIVGLPFLILSFFLVGFGLLDLPLSIRGDALGNRLSFITRNFFSTVALGGVFSLSFLVPGLSLILLPIGYAAAVFLIRGIGEAEDRKL